MAELSTHYISMIVVPPFITHSHPQLLHTHFHSSCRGLLATTNQADRIDFCCIAFFLLNCCASYDRIEKCNIIIYTCTINKCNFFADGKTIAASGTVDEMVFFSITYKCLGIKLKRIESTESLYINYYTCVKAIKSTFCLSFSTVSKGYKP